MIHRKLNQYLICLFTPVKYPKEKEITNRDFHIRANIIDTSFEKDKERFLDGKSSTKTFLKYISQVRISPKERSNVIFVVDADRQNIYEQSNKKSNFFEYQRQFFISQAIKYGFSVIDMEKLFKKTINLIK